MKHKHAFEIAGTWDYCEAYDLFVMACTCGVWGFAGGSSGLPKRSFTVTMDIDSPEGYGLLLSRMWPVIKTRRKNEA